jgi:hypothetical protein
LQVIPDDFPVRIFQIPDMAAMTGIPHFLPPRQRRISLDCITRPVDETTPNLGNLCK